MNTTHLTLAAGAFFQTATSSGQITSIIALAVGLFAIAANSINMLGVVRKDGEERGALRTTLDGLKVEIGFLRAGRDEDRAAREHIVSLISDLAREVSRIAGVTDSLVERRRGSDSQH